MTKSQKLARNRGNRFEHRVAKLLDGLVYAGTDGDVEIPGTPFRIECKYTMGLANFKIKEWHDQILTYEKRNPHKIFALAYSGGRPIQNARIWVTIPLSVFQFLLDTERKGTIRQLAKQMEEEENEATSNRPTFKSDRGIGE